MLRVLEVIAPMTEHDFEAHRHIKGNLELLFRDALDLPDLSIERTLGGMSNINMLADSKQERLVLRIPVLLMEFPSTHYAQEFLILHTAAKKGLSPRPLHMGLLLIEIKPLSWLMITNPG